MEDETKSASSDIKKIKTTTKNIKRNSCVKLSEKLWLDEDIVAREILSRLPVKSLMKFKCVCKNWMTLIEEESSFIDLHLERAKTRPGFLITNLKDNNKATFMIADLFFQDRGGALSSLAVQTIRKIDYTYIDTMLKPVDGLIGFFGENIEPGVCICNLATREVTPWIKSTSLSNLRKEDREPFSFPWASCTLGYDPVTKVHKVVGIWRSEQPKRLVGEVLTVGDNKWRKIDEVPPHELEYIGSSVYINGLIYYTTQMLSIWEAKCKDTPRYLVTFDLGSEKFKAIRVPSGIFYHPTNDCFAYYRVKLLELGGRLALLVESSESNDIHDLWLFDNEDKNKRVWVAIPLEIPYLSDGSMYNSVHPVLGTDQIILTSTFRSSVLSSASEIPNTTCYSYNWKNETLSKVDVLGIPSSGPCFCAASRNTVSLESLLPVQKRRVRTIGSLRQFLTPEHYVPPHITSTRTTHGLEVFSLQQMRW
ncbi:F-box protein At1g30790-like [Papaver somniferum]|uniref:F-box protein At1g30790-like n=1 Tax=Papaver somniferum TaxID=3469 RepID=UPI000E700DD0|nr:F-box protein At1g30790-like [Papaver somniferum]